MSAPERPALTVAERPRSLVQLIARKRKVDLLSAAMKDAFGLDLPPPGKWAPGAGVDPSGSSRAAGARERAFTAGRIMRAARRRGVRPRGGGRSEQRLERDPLRRRAGAVGARDLMPSRPPSARLRTRLGGDDPDRPRRLRNPSRRPDAEFRPRRRLDLCALADRGASGSLRPIWRPVRTGAEALSLRDAGLRTPPDDAALGFTVETSTSAQRL